MTDTKKMQDIILRQKTVAAELEKEINDILSSDLTVENESLKKEVRQLQLFLEESGERVKLISSQNVELKNALYEQIFNEKVQIINATLKKNDVYFRSKMVGEMNRLAQLEKSLLDRVNFLTNQMQKNRVEASHEIYEKLDALSIQAGELARSARTQIEKEAGAFTKESREQFEKLKNEQVTDETVVLIGKKNNLEAFVGGNLINKLGIVFVILGIIAVSQFTFLRLPDTFKGIIMFLISGALLVTGELLNRKKANYFSLGITSGGIAGLYASLSISHFALKIISRYPALLLCLLITAGAFVLSRRYSSQTIAAFAMIGGYIPIVSISESVVLTYGAMLYFVVLNLLALTFSFYKKWKATMFIGYFLNLIGTVYILINVIDARYNDRIGFGVLELSAILYILFAFAIYTVIPIISNFRNKHPFTKPDVVILGLNTLFSALIMYLAFYAFNISKFNGLMAIIFAVTYVFLGRFVETHFDKEKHTMALFYLTGLSFVILVIPFQFEKEWLSLGWLAQGTCLAVYGILNRESRFKKAGFVIAALCLSAFLYFDLYWRIDDLFSYKYFAMSLGSVIILAALAYKKSMTGFFDNAYKYAVLINTWFYCTYLVSLLDDYWRGLGYAGYNTGFLLSALWFTITFLLAYIFPRIPVVVDKGVKIISVVMSIIGMLGVLALISFGSITRFSLTDGSHMPLSIMIVASLVLIALCGLAVLAMKGVLMFFIVESRLPVEWLPVGISAYFLLLLSQNLVSQYGLSFTSIVISIIYVAAALGWIVYGFIKRFAFMRRFGLGLSIFAVAKLFLVDLSDLTQGNKIVSYFAFGITLLGISFVYQYFSKRLIPKGDDIAHGEKDNL